MAMLQDVRGRQLASFGNNDLFYGHQQIPTAVSQGHQYGYYARQNSPPTTNAHPSAPAPPHGAPAQSYRYGNHEMDFLGAPDYRIYAPSSPMQQNVGLPSVNHAAGPVPTPTAAAAGAPLAPAPYYPGYVRSVPQEMLQPIEAVPRLPVMNAPTHDMPQPPSMNNRLPSPFGGAESISSRRVENFPGIRKTTKRSHSCTVCGKVFARPSALQTHLYSHTGEKPYKCEHTGCGRRFSVVSNLRRHARVHKE